MLNVIDDTVHTLPAGQSAPVVAGFVTRPEDCFLLGFGAKGAAGANCALIAFSVTDGRFSHAGESLEDTTATPLAPDDELGVDAGTP